MQLPIKLTDKRCKKCNSFLFVEINAETNVKTGIETKKLVIEKYLCSLCNTSEKEN